VTLAAGLARARASDIALVIRAADGDPAAFDALIEPRLAKLLRMARAIVRDEAVARDVVQDTCVRAWRELARVREPARFDAWLAQILVNGCRTELRRIGRRGIREIALDQPSTGAGAAERPARETALGDRVVEAEAVRRAFLRVDPDDRVVLVLHYVEDRPIDEIAAMMGIPAGTVKWRLSRARAALERALEAER
jgi:RNA polymerase sigma-70 factor (ECF subfamily)